VRHNGGARRRVLPQVRHVAAVERLHLVIPDEVIAERALRLLALGLGVRRIAETMSRHPREVLAADDIRAVLALSAPRVRDELLLPPTRAAFVGRTLLPPAGRRASAIDVGEGDLDRLRTLALELIEEIGTADRLVMSRDHATPADAWRSAALQYAMTVMQQAQILQAVDAAVRDPASIHAQVGDDDRERLRDWALASPWSPHPTLDLAVAKWGRYSASFARGEEQDPAEVGDAINIRCGVERAMTSVSDTGRARIAERVAPHDDLFRGGAPAETVAALERRLSEASR
jgi:hypothetical protein